MELYRFKQLLESHLGDVKPLLTEEEKIITDFDKDYDYKEDEGKFYFKLKDTPKSTKANSLKTQGKYIDWTEATGSGLSAIKTKVFKMNPAGSGGGESSLEPQKLKEPKKTEKLKEPKKKSGCVWGNCEGGKGKLILSTSEIQPDANYVGDCKGNGPSGTGKYTFPDGSYQVGSFEHNYSTLFHMYGKEFYPNGTIKFVGKFYGMRTPMIDYVFLPLSGSRYYANGRLEFTGSFIKDGWRLLEGTEMLTKLKDTDLSSNVKMETGVQIIYDGKGNVTSRKKWVNGKS